jgi:SAM-dependent methyltransferase
LNETPDIHGAHPYPCKFPPQSIRRFLEPGGGVLLDPFCGSGTTVVDAAAHGWRQVYGFDSNPIAVLISQFKTLRIDAVFFVAADSALADFAISAERTKPARTLSFHGATHWFAKHVLRDLEKILSWIDLYKDVRIKTWLRLSLSRIVNRVSRQDSETRYVAVDRRIDPGETFERFADSAAATLSMLRDRSALSADIVVGQAEIRSGIPLKDGSVDRIVTSPPYANSMDYYLYHKQRMNVLGYDFKQAQNMEIGSRHEYSSQRAPAQKWFSDYRQSLRDFRRVLREGGDAIVIIGDSQIAGKKVDAAELTAAIATDLGFSTQLVESVALEGRSRSFSRGFQRPNKFEHVLKLVATNASQTGQTMRYS